LADLARHASSSSSIAAVVAGTEVHADLFSWVSCSSVVELLTFCADGHSFDSSFEKLGIFLEWLVSLTDSSLYNYYERLFKLPQNSKEVVV
jgi:hypothetical protein